MDYIEQQNKALKKELRELIILLECSNDILKQTSNHFQDEDKKYINKLANEVDSRILKLKDI